MLRFNASADSIQKENRLQRMAHAMGIGSCDGLETEIAEAICDMNARLGLSAILAALGVTPDM